MAAPKGNQYAIGNNGGRPAIHTDPQVVSDLVDSYFDYIKGNTADNINPEPPTVTGLTLHLGFSSKSTLYDYSEKKEFSHSIKRALTRIEQYHEIKASQGDKCTGNIFVLKNFGWKDTQEISHDLPKPLRKHFSDFGE